MFGSLKIILQKRKKEMKRIEKLIQKYPSRIICLFFIAMSACQQADMTVEATYSNDIYLLKEYKVERHPTVVRNGCGLDIYHEGNTALDTMYLSNKLPSWHPNYPYDNGATLKKYSSETGDSIAFNYDLLFYNEFAYAQNYAGDYNGSGYPVIFMYTDPQNDNNSTKAVMVGQGVTFFNNFTADSITAARIAGLEADPLIDLASYRTELHTSTVDGSVMLQSTIAPIYKQLVIGNKFRPTIGGVFTISDASDEAQEDLQPVFLIKTREGFYAKFMVTRFKGVGADTQKLTLQWQAIKK
jgi:hypothetical protein